QNLIAFPADEPALSDTVTTLTIDGAPSWLAGADRRRLAVYQLADVRIELWDQTYAPRVTGTALYLPARRVDAQRVEIGRAIVGTELRAGVRIAPQEIERGRRVMLADASATPTLARVTDVSFDERVATMSVMDNMGVRLLQLHSTVA